MSRRIVSIALFALGATALPLGAQAKPAVRKQGTTTTGAVEKAAVNKAWADAIATFKTGNASAIAALYTADAMMLDPSMPTIMGRANIEKSMQAMFATTKLIDMTHKSDALDVFGDVAIDNGTYSQTLQEKGKAPVTVRSRYTIVFRQVDGKWLVHRDVGTPLPPPAAAPAKK